MLNKKRPRLIGSDRSKFFAFVKSNLSQTLSRRFQPLIYFWGTNPQTALFGYLQGQSSDHEVPRSKFKRQYLYVNDVQYLASNVDLSQHYATSNNNIKRRPFQLEPSKLREQLQQQETSGSQLDENIRLALNNLLSPQTGGPKLTGEAKAGNVNLERREHEDRPKSYSNDCSSSSSASSSSDSGVFASTSSASSRASSASGSSFTIDMATAEKCSCPALYHTSDPHHDDLHHLLEPLNSAASHLRANHEKQPTPPVDSEPRQQQQADPAGANITSEQLEFGQCALDWYCDSHKHYHKNKLVALISAGMTTGSDKKYVTDTVSTLERLGYEVCVFIRRGVGGLKLNSTRFFSPSKWRDFEAAIQSVRRQRPGAKLVAIGFSFGSIELCRYLSMSGANSLVSAALLISCPFDPEAGGRNMRKRALNRRIDAYLAKNLGKQLYQALSLNASNQEQEQDSSNSSSSSSNQYQLINYNGSMIDLSCLPKIKSLVDFEDNYNRVIQNYPNSEAYADDSRLSEHLNNIKTPTLCLSSEDDFMAPMKLLPIKQIEANKNLCMLLTKRGGHMAFIDGLFWPKKPYFAQRIIHNYMLAMRGSISQREDPSNQIVPPELPPTSPSSQSVQLTPKSSMMKDNLGRNHHRQILITPGDTSKTRPNSKRGQLQPVDHPQQRQQQQQRQRQHRSHPNRQKSNHLLQIFDTRTI